MKRDVMKALTAARPPHVDLDAPVDGHTRSKELTYAMTAQPRAGTTIRRWPVWGLGLVGAAAATTVAVAAATTTGTPPAGRSPSRAPTAKLDARTVLQAAAEKAEAQPAATGAYWHTKTRSLHYFRARGTGGSYTVEHRNRTESWIPFEPDKDMWSVDQYLGSAPATPADTETWKLSGSPTMFSISGIMAAAAPATGGKQLPAKPGRVYVSKGRPVDRDKIFWLGRNVSMADLRSLPQDPAELKKWLLTMYEGHSTEAESDRVSAGQWLFDVTRGLILEMPVTPKTRAAAFRMLADLPGVTVIDQAKDADGRAGTAVALTTTNKSGTVQHRILFDGASSRGLGDELVLVRPGGLSTGSPPGSVWISNVVQQAGWTDTRPTLKPTTPIGRQRHIPR